MKIAIISDIQGNLPALQAVLAKIDAEDVDHIINVGDTLGGPLNQPARQPCLWRAALR